MVPNGAKHLTGPILEFKGSAHYLWKGHPNLVTLDLFLQNRRQSKVLATININWFPSCTNFYGMLYFLQFIVSSWRFLEFLVIVGETFRTFTFFSFSKKLTKIPLPKWKIHKKNLKKIFKSLPTMVGPRRKFWFLEHLKYLFHHFENTSISGKLT